MLKIKKKLCINSLQSYEYGGISVYASKWERLLNWGTIPYFYIKNSTGSLMSPHLIAD
jgi:hypothetical protein